MTKIVFYASIILLSLLIVMDRKCLSAELKKLREIAKKSPSVAEMISILDEHMNLHLKKVEHLKQTRKKILEVANDFQLTPDILPSDLRPILDYSRLYDPVQAFTMLNRILEITRGEEEYMEVEEDEERCDTRYTGAFRYLISDERLPDEDMVRDLAKTLLRLQEFYNISTDDMILAKFPHSSSCVTDPNKVAPLSMTHSESLELGKTAYDAENFPVALSWFRKALEQMREAAVEDEPDKIAIGEKLSMILDYASFAAYKSGHVRDGKEMTEKWLEYQPDHERAIENLKYYEEELNGQEGGKEFQDQSAGLDDRSTNAEGSLPKTLDNSVKEHIFSGYEHMNEHTFDPDEYSLTTDKIARRLCQRAKEDGPGKGSCSSRTVLNEGVPGLKIHSEVLFEQPKIIRIHNLITSEEANHLIKLSEPKLQRSTVQTKAGTITSNFRIADTAWISGESDSIVRSIERRIASLVNISMEESEDLQVVNYDVGGFYGPHLDSARAPRSYCDQYLTEEQLERGDRLATILIYLNNVEAGGSTIFPKLNLAVEPIPNSAVFWINLKKDGFADAMTLHTGCPVLVGSKWIATKWPNERCNVRIGDISTCVNRPVTM